MPLWYWLNICLCLCNWDCDRPKGPSNSPGTCLLCSIEYCHGGFVNCVHPDVWGIVYYWRYRCIEKLPCWRWREQPLQQKLSQQKSIGVLSEVVAWLIQLFFLYLQTMFLGCKQSACDAYSHVADYTRFGFARTQIRPTLLDVFSFRAPSILISSPFLLISNLFFSIHSRNKTRPVKICLT